ncbi:hypothetical protein F8388_026417 [Cannabis sativa]|uniref:Uncharacterized protein n=1 Tax=Cannabis sativa TaxID=3483 RepID=A0A7J6ETG1_CANSA|nr:hypothetical protein F8388_026417 [Cannabis sativa]
MEIRCPMAGAGYKTIVDFIFLINDLGGTRSKASSSEDDDDGENEPRKLTRAQRNRLREKNLKIDASRRGRIVGPLLPPTEVNTLNKSKVKQRRMARCLSSK